MLYTSPSDLDSFRTYQRDDDFPLDLLLKQMRRETQPTPEMMRGRAFAAAMERVGEGESLTIQADGFTFAFTCDADIPNLSRREEWGRKDYGGVTVRARCDRRMGRLIVDDKTTSHFDAEGYQDRFQWRFYLDIFEADRFDWHIWEVKELEPKAYEVFAHHILTQYRYPALSEDCRRVAEEFLDFSRRIGWEGRA